MRGVPGGLAMSAIPLPALRAREARFLCAKRCIRCAACGRQTDYAPTAMADIRLPLKIWFAAIQLLIVDPNLSAAELQRRLSISASDRAPSPPGAGRPHRRRLHHAACGTRSKISRGGVKRPLTRKKPTNAAATSSRPKSKRNPLAKPSLCFAASQVTPQCPRSQASLFRSSDPIFTWR